MPPEPPVAAASAAATDSDAIAGENFQWDSAAEAELQAIEASYSSKRRRLPDWSSGSGGRRRRHIAGAVGGGGDPYPSTLSWVLSPPPCRVNAMAKYQAMKFGGEIVYCKTPLEVEQAAMELLDKIKTMEKSDQVSLGFDIEWRPVFQRGAPPSKAAVMQICMDATQCYVMHIIHSGIPPILKSLLADSSSLKVGICINNDAWKILKDYDVCVQPLMDLSNLANLKLVGPPKRWSLSSLTEAITCKELPKPNKIRMGNWEADVLSKEQLQYAATDAYVSWYLCQVLQRLPDNTDEAEKNRESNRA